MRAEAVPDRKRIPSPTRKAISIRETARIPSTRAICRPFFGKGKRLGRVSGQSIHDRRDNREDRDPAQRPGRLYLSAGGQCRQPPGLRRHPKGIAALRARHPAAPCPKAAFGAAVRGYRRLTRPASAAFTSYLLGPPPLRSFSAAPIRPAIPCPFQKPILDEIAAQGDIIVKNIPQDSIDLFFRIGASGFELFHDFCQGDHLAFSLAEKTRSFRGSRLSNTAERIFSRSLSVTSKRSSRIRTGGAGRVPSSCGDLQPIAIS